MPIYQFICENKHIITKHRTKPYKHAMRYRCPTCGYWMYRDIIGEHKKGVTVKNLDYDNDPLSFLSTKRSFKGRWIENLTPEPVFVRDKRQYHNLLQRTNSREKER